MKGMNAPRLDSLTGLRFIAALGVALCHFVFLMGITGVAAGGLLFWQYGVDFFFILSGFVLTWSWNPVRTAGRFYWLRFARIWPIHAVVIMILIVLGVSGHWGDALLEIALFNQWFPLKGRHVGINPVTWTLSVEMAFYLIFPWIIRPLRRISSRHLVIFVGALWLVGGMWSVAGRSVLHIHDMWWRESSPLFSMPEFLIGLAIALLLQRHQGSVRLERAGFLLGLVCLLALLGLYVCVHQNIVNDRHLPPWPFMVDIPFACLIGVVAMGDLRRPGRCPGWLVTLGEWSFALYLVHRDGIYYRVWPHLTALPTPVSAVILVVLAIAASGLLYVLIERPVERWLRVRGPGRRAPAASTGA